MGTRRKHSKKALSQKSTVNISPKGNQSTGGDIVGRDKHIVFNIYIEGLITDLINRLFPKSQPPSSQAPLMQQGKLFQLSEGDEGPAHLTATEEKLAQAKAKAEKALANKRKWNKYLAISFAILAISFVVIVVTLSILGKPIISGLLGAALPSLTPTFALPATPTPLPNTSGTSSVTASNEISEITFALGSDSCGATLEIVDQSSSVVLSMHITPGTTQTIKLPAGNYVSNITYDCGLGSGLTGAAGNGSLPYSESFSVTGGNHFFISIPSRNMSFLWYLIIGIGLLVLIFMLIGHKTK